MWFTTIIVNRVDELMDAGTIPIHEQHTCKDKAPVLLLEDMKLGIAITKLIHW